MQTNLLQYLLNLYKDTTERLHKLWQCSVRGLLVALNKIIFNA